VTPHLRLAREVQQFYSTIYDDIYFSQADPEAEKQFVFIEANRIAGRIRESESFTVAELGFGFGLNYALTVHAAKQADCLYKLRYYSVEENFPDEAAVKALAAQLKICRTEFTSPPTPLHIVERGAKTQLGSYNETSQPPPSPYNGEGGRGGEVYHGDVLTFLQEATFSADVWYFDGFSPAKNAAMWSENVFNRAFALTKPGGTFSTYSSAGWVRRNLVNAGFLVEKVPGFAGKREMLVGRKP